MFDDMTGDEVNEMVCSDEETSKEVRRMSIANGDRN
jgi:hypothetical protein